MVAVLTPGFTTSKAGKRNIITNSCSEALINKAGKFQAVTIDGHNIDPKALKVQEHKKCSPRKLISKPPKPASSK